ncbi:MAG: sterol desaturase family protein [Pseudomonadota bacterium]
MTAVVLEALQSAIDNTFFLIGLLILAVEILAALWSRRLSKGPVLDAIASVSTQVPYLVVEILVLGLAYVGYVVVADTVVSWTFDINVFTVIAAVIACDFLYYWEHRFAHEIRLLWTQHAVHHSSRYMNIAVGVRFGPFEGVVSALVHLPLVFVGFPAELVFFGIVVVLAYQTWIHTELIGRLGVLDGVFNTPSNHRVHHGCDDKYLDKNYGGILIIWDRLFGTYQAEEETPRFGLKRSFDSVNPLIVWFSEVPGLVRDIRRASSFNELWKTLFAHPSWAESRAKAANALPANTADPQSAS